jgi:hypothetical protein
MSGDKCEIYLTFLLKIQKTNAVFVSDTRIYNSQIKQVHASTSGTSLCRPCKVLVLDKRSYCAHAHWYQICKFLQVTSTVTTKRIGTFLHKFMKYT